MYTAAVLTPNSRLLLRWMSQALLRVEEKWFVFVTQQGGLLPHHMTINLGKLDPKLNDLYLLGKQVTLSLEEIWLNETLGVCASPVIKAGYYDEKGNWEGIASINSHPHITICVKPPSKPVVSNELFKEKQKCLIVKLDQIYDLEAIVEEVH
jgi:hypothetical protein